MGLTCPLAQITLRFSRSKSYEIITRNTSHRPTWEHRKVFDLLKLNDTEF